MRRSLFIAAALLLYSVAASAETIIIVTDTEPRVSTEAAFGIGAMSRALPASVRSGTTDPGAPSDYTIDPASSKSLWLSLGFEKQSFVFMTDLTFGGTSASGTSMRRVAPVYADGMTPVPYTGTLLESSIALRLGARVEVGDLTLEAGGGIGGSLWLLASATVDHTGSVFDAPRAPGAPDASWFVPVWAAATYKISDGWGLQVLAESDRQSVDGPGSITVGIAMVSRPGHS